MRRCIICELEFDELESYGSGYVNSRKKCLNYIPVHYPWFNYLLRSDCLTILVDKEPISFIKLAENNWTYHDNMKMEKILGHLTFSDQDLIDLVRIKKIIKLANLLK
jgi:hypothetical protein